MRRLVLTGLLILLTVGPAAALEVPFRDGSVIEAVGYTVTGSYIMIEKTDGTKVAFDVGDIDLDALQRAEVAAAEPEPEAPAESPKTLGVTSSLTLPEGDDGTTSGLTITDQHVKHVRGSGIEGPEDETEEAEAEAESSVPPGFQQGGGVLLNNVKVTPAEGGQWQVTGEVLNRSQATVLDVQATLQAEMPDGQPPWATNVPITGALGPDESSNFSHTFGTPSGAGDGWTPKLQVNVIWQQGETRLEPQYNQNAPHPSQLPLDRGGVGGAETRQQEEEVID
jgi:hypothetical protein